MRAPLHRSLRTLSRCDMPTIWRDGPKHHWGGREGWDYWRLCTLRQSTLIQTSLLCLACLASIPALQFGMLFCLIAGRRGNYYLQEFRSFGTAGSGMGGGELESLGRCWKCRCHRDRRPSPSPEHARPLSYHLHTQQMWAV